MDFIFRILVLSGMAASRQRAPRIVFILAATFLGHCALAHERTPGDGRVVCEFAKLGRRRIFAEHVEKLAAAPRTPKRNTFSSPESVVEALHAIYNEDPTLLTPAKLESRTVDMLLSAHFERPRSGSRLYRAVLREFGSLPHILDELGLGPAASVRTGRTFVLTPLPPPVARKTRIPERDRFAIYPESAEAIAEAEAWAIQLLDKYDRSFFHTFFQNSPEGNARHTRIFRVMNYLRYQRELVSAALGSESEDVAWLSKRIDKLERAILKIHIGYRMVFRGKFMPRFNLDETVIEEAIDDALLRAVRKFDPSLGTRFGTYAERWVYTFIHRAIGKKAKAELERPRAQSATYNPGKMIENRAKVDVHRKVQSIQAKYDENARRILLINLYEAQGDPKNQGQRTLEAEVLRRIWGLGREDADYAEPYTFRELGEILGVDRQRVHQIFVTAERELEIFKRQLQSKYLNYLSPADAPLFEEEEGED